MTVIPPIIRGHPIWSVRKYLHWPEMRLIEFNDGVVTELPTPTAWHQHVLFNLMCPIDSYVEKHELGTVIQCPFPIQTGHRRYREPDLSFRRHSTTDSDPKETYFWDNVQFVAEILAETSKERKRDLIDKRVEYAEAGIAEYWIVDSQLIRSAAKENPKCQPCTTRSLNLLLADRLPSPWRILNRRLRRRSMFSI